MNLLLTVFILLLLAIVFHIVMSTANSRNDKMNYYKKLDNWRKNKAGKNN